MKGRAGWMALIVPILLGLGMSAEAENKTVCLLVKRADYMELLPELRQWAVDVNAEGDYTVYVVPGDWVDAGAVRRYLQASLANCARAGQPLAGALLVGDMPHAQWEFPDGADILTAPIDTYFMDLNSEWVDANGNGIFEGTRNGQVHNDIWVGRLTPNMPGITDRTPVELLRNYFRKNHAVRMGQRPVRPAALIYADLHGDEPDRLFTAGALYPNTKVVYQRSETSGDDYLNRLSGNASYEFVYLDCHSSTSDHGIADNNPLLDDSAGVTSRQIHDADPHAYFYWLDTCVAGRFTAENYIAGCYLFDTTYGLFAVAITRSSGMPFPQFCAMAERRNDDWGTIVQHAFPDGQYELVLLGDPTLSPVFQSPLCTLEIPDSTFQQPIKIPKPAVAGNESWGIPVRGRMVTGGDEGLVNFQLAASSAAAGVSGGNPRPLLIQGVGSRSMASAEIQVRNTTPLGKYQISVTGSACGMPDVRVSGWVEVVDPVAVRWPQFAIRNAPDALMLTAGDRTTLSFTIAITNRSTNLPMLVKAAASCPNNRDAHGQTVLCLPGVEYAHVTDASQVLNLPIWVTSVAPAGVYAVTFTFQGGAQTIAKTVQITVRRPRLNISFQPDAFVSLVPGTAAQRTVTVSLAQGGYADVRWEATAVPAGLNIITPLPGGGESWLLGTEKFFALGNGAEAASVSAVLDIQANNLIPAGTYQLPVACSISDEPANRTVRNLAVEILSQYAMSIEPSIAGYLRICITNRVPLEYRLNLAMQSDCPATLLTPQVTVRGMGSATGTVSYSTVFPRSSSYYANLNYKIRLTATSPDHPEWPAVVCTYTVFKGVSLVTPPVISKPDLAPTILPGDLQREGKEGLPIPPPGPSP